MKQKFSGAAALFFTFFSLLVLPGFCSSAQAQDSRMLGNWQNVNAETRGITKVHIFSVGNRIRVHVWGKCHPNDCDWGVVDGYAEGENVNSNLSEARTITATYNQGFNVTNLVIRLSRQEQIRVEAHTRFTDNSGRAPYHSVEVMAKGERARTGLAAFTGNWRNIDTQTPGVTTVQITGYGSQLKIHVWGQCRPTDCDWGVTDGFMEGRSVSADPNEAQVLTATYENSWSVKTLIIRALGNDRLAVEIHTRFTDNSGRSAYTKTFVMERR